MKDLSLSHVRIYDKVCGKKYQSRVLRFLVFAWLKFLNENKLFDIIQGKLIFVYRTPIFLDDKKKLKKHHGFLI